MSFGSGLRRRSLIGVAGVVLAGPLSLAFTTPGRAAPTLTIAQAQVQLAALQTQEDVAAEMFDAGTIAAAAAANAVQVAQATVLTQSLKLNDMQQRVRYLAVGAYTGDGLNPIDELLAGGDPQTLLTKAGDINEVARHESAQLTALTAEQQIVANAQLIAADRQAAAVAAVKGLAAAKDRISKVIALEQGVLSHLQAQQRAELLAEQARQRAAAQAAARAAIAAIKSQQLLAAVTARDRAAAPIAVAPVIAAVAAAVPQAAAPQTTAPTPTTPASASVPAGPASSSPSPASSSTPPSSAASNPGQIAMQAALSQQGKPYVYGTAGPDTYDCSGLVMWAFAQAGISLPHNAAAQYGYGTHVSISQLQPGDIVFYDEGGYIGHDGIYVGNGEMVDANHTGSFVGVRALYSGLIGGTRL